LTPASPAGFPNRSWISLSAHPLPSGDVAEDGLQKTWDWFVNNQDEYLKKKNYFQE
jgi:hypothetical protein